MSHAASFESKFSISPSRDSLAPPLSQKLFITHSFAPFGLKLVRIATIGDADAGGEAVKTQNQLIYRQERACIYDISIRGGRVE